MWFLFELSTWKAASLFCQYPLSVIPGLKHMIYSCSLFLSEDYNFFPYPFQTIACKWQSRMNEGTKIYSYKTDTQLLYDTKNKKNKKKNKNKNKKKKTYGLLAGRFNLYCCTINTHVGSCDWLILTLCPARVISYLKVWESRSYLHFCKVVS